MPFKIIRNFIKLESASGIILFVVAVFALIVDNSPLHSTYQTLSHAPIGLHLGKWNLSYSLTEWINQGLMTLFFLLVGLEIKREILIGELNSLAKISLPAIAALGGMLFPALIYIAFNHNSTLLHGWAIPTATDIAFALGVISLLGRRIPVALKMFLMALAIFDDIGAIIIIGFFYTEKISFIFTILAVLSTLVLININRIGVKKLWPYLTIGVMLWLFMLYSGIHAVIAGIILASTIPLQGKENAPSPLKKLEMHLHPWVAYLILPLFGFFNAGINFLHATNQQWFNNLSLGIMLGLFFGKQIGIFTTTWLAIKTKIAPMPKDATWMSLYGIALVCGIGFTMSLFIGNLAFGANAITEITSVRFGVLMGSLLSGLCGFFILHQIHKQ